MFFEFLSLELKSALRRPMIYIFFFLVALMCFMAVVSDSVVIGGSIGNVYKNAPFVITQFVSILSFIVGILCAVAFFNNAALRDYTNQFNEILFSTPISKAAYFFGRFFGALILATIPLLGIYFGVILGSWIGPLAGWIDADRIGPFYLSTFINNYFLFILPNMFFGGAIIFALASRFKSTVVSFVGALLLIIGYGISGTLLSDVDNEKLGALLDIFGNRAYTVYSRYFTPIEKNTLSPAFEGILLYNRLIWISVGAVILSISYWVFSFKEKHRKKKVKVEGAVDRRIIDKPIELSIAHGATSHWQQFISFFKISFLNIIKSMVFKVIFLFAFIILLVDMISGYEYFGLQSYPLTYIVVDMIRGSSQLFIIIVLVFFSGELIWNDRTSHINEVINATPHASIISLLSKVATLLGVVTLLYFFFVTIGIVYQLIMGFTFIEFDIYLLTFIYDLLPVYLFYTVFFLFIQVLVNQKYLAYFISILLLFVWDILLNVLDILSNMLDLGGSPTIEYSDMNGYGPGLKGAFWFGLYWTLFAFILLLKAGLYWVRSSGSTFKNRMKQAFSLLKGKYAMLFILVCVIWLATASFVFYNTQVLNSYKTNDELEELAVEYEKKYKKYQHITLPKIKAVTYHVDIYPKERNLMVKADILIKNESNTPIDSIHYNLDEQWETNFTIPHAKLVYNDDTLGYKIFRLSPPLKPGDSFTIQIENNYISQGFENDRGNTSIVRNGTFVNNKAILPTMGYYSDAELSDKNDRKKYGLPPKDRMPELEENCSDKCMINYLSDGRSDWVEIETFISTSDDQTAIAPGSLVREWQEEGRNHYHYRVDHPSQDFASFISADYEVAKRDWNGISMEVYYDEKHDYNIEMMLDAIEKSLKYYTKNFGPYYHKQARIIEFPSYATFAQAFPGTMPYSESFGFITNLEDTTKNNVIDAVIAHEMAHQWWAHQVVGASMQGGTMLSESFAEYSSLMVMKKEHTDLEMKEFLKYDFRRYLGGRSRETDKELPLYKVENQSYIHYGKGSLLLYALQHTIGEGKVNNALRNFLEEYRYQAPPYPTSLDFIKYLEKEVPDSLQYLITDWFKEITLYDFRLEDATYKKVDGKYMVDLNLKARKLKADTIGNETEAMVNDWVEVGLFKDADEKELLALELIKIDQAEMTYQMVVDTIPYKAAIDPKRILIERVYDDNFKKVSEIDF